jgi:hypothetical protein
MLQQHRVQQQGSRQQCSLDGVPTPVELPASSRWCPMQASAQPHARVRCQTPATWTASRAALCMPRPAGSCSASEELPMSDCVCRHRGALCEGVGAGAVCTLQAGGSGPHASSPAAAASPAGTCRCTAGCHLPAWPHPATASHVTHQFRVLSCNHKARQSPAMAATMPWCDDAAAGAPLARAWPA